MHFFKKIGRIKGNKPTSIFFYVFPRAQQSNLKLHKSLASTVQKKHMINNLLKKKCSNNVNKTLKELQN